MPVDKKQLKEALLKTLAEKGDYTTILSHLSSEEKEEKDSQFKELIKPMSAVADILVGNATGAFTEPLKKHIDERAEELRSDFTEQLTKDKEELSQAIAEAFSGRNSEFTKEILENFTKSQDSLTQTITSEAVRVAAEKAEEMYERLGEDARLTEGDIESIIEQTALSVESQLDGIIGSYIDEQGISVAQIRDFTENVQRLLPQVDFSKISVDWSQVRNAPSQGGTNANLIRQIAQEIVDASGGGYTNLTEFVDQTPYRVFYSNGSGDVTELALGADGTFLKSNGASSAPSFATPAGSGDVSKVGTPVNNQVGVWTGDGTIEGDADLTFDTTTNTLATVNGAFSGDVTVLDEAYDATGWNGDLSVPTKNAVRDVVDPIKTKVDNITVTQAVDLDALEAASHAAVTVSDTAEIDLTLTGQQISASIVAGSIDESKLDASVNASLDLADSSVQHLNGISIDNTLARYHSTTGKVIQTSGAAVDDSGNISATNLSGTNTGDQTSIVGITGTKAQFDTAVTDGNIVYQSDALGTPSSGTLTNCTGLPLAGVVDSTTEALGVGSLELGHASDTTLSRSSAGVLAVEGVVIPTISSTNTLTNKRITKRVGSTTSSATPTINTDNVDAYHLTAQTADITSFTTNLSGTPTDYQQLRISVTGTASRLITFGASFSNGPVALPTTTSGTTRLDILFEYSTVTSTWRCMASGSQV